MGVRIRDKKIKQRSLNDRLCTLVSQYNSITFHNFIHGIALNMSCVRQLRKKDSENENELVVTGITDTTSSETPVPNEADIPTQIAMSPENNLLTKPNNSHIDAFDKQYSTARCKGNKKRKVISEPGVTTRSKRIKSTQ